MLPLLMLALLATAAPLDEPAPRIEDVLAANPVREDLNCGFTTTARSSEYPDEIRVERFTPPDQWQLLSVNGEPPAADVLAEYAEAAEERLGQRSSPEQMDFASLIHVDSATVEAEDADTVTFSFRPRVQGRDGEEDGSRNLGEKLRGTLTVTKDGLRPLRSQLTNTEPISPAPTVKFRTFRQEMTFAFDPAVGASFVKSMEFVMRGRMLVFKKVNSESRIEFGELDCRAVDSGQP